MLAGEGLVGLVHAFQLAGAQLRACIQACEICSAMCEKHGSKMAHCRVCDEACRRCARACEDMTDNIAVIEVMRMIDHK